MAVSAPTDLGKNTPTAGSSSSTVTFTTTATVPSGGKIILFVGWFGASINLSSVSATGCSGGVSKQQDNGSDHFAIAYLDAPSGLASGSAVTATFSSASADSRYISGCYVTGAATGDGYGSVGASATSATWAPGAVSVTAAHGDIVFGGSYAAGTNVTSTPTFPTIELHDFAIVGDSSMTDGYILSSGSLSMTGLWSASNALASAAIAYSSSDGVSGPPSVASVAKSSTNTAGTSHVVTMPSGIASGDLLIVCLDKGSTAATIDSLAGWTELLDENSANGLYIAYRKADGTEGASITLTSSASTRDATIVLRIVDMKDPATQAPEVATTGTGTSATPDPPSLSPTGGAKNYLFVAMAGMAGEEADDNTWGNTSPSNYLPSVPLQKSCGTAGTNLGGLVLAAVRNANTATENPGTFGVDVSAAWRSQTIAVHPPDPAVEGPPRFSPAIRPFEEMLRR